MRTGVGRLKSNTYLCDVCKRSKEQVNRWWIVTTGESLILQTWDKATPEEIENAAYHLCGEAHALQIVNTWMGNQSRPVTIEGAQ